MNNQQISCNLVRNRNYVTTLFPLVIDDITIIDGYWVDQSKEKYKLFEYHGKADFLLKTKNSIGNKIRFLLIQDSISIPLNGLEGEVYEITSDEITIPITINKELFTAGGQTEKDTVAQLYLKIYEEADNYDKEKIKGKYPIESGYVDLPRNDQDFLKVHLVRFIPEVMGNLNWVKGKEVQDIWFASGANSDPTSGAPQVNFLSEKWISGFSRLQGVIEKAKNSWNTPAAKNSLRSQIRKMKEQGFIKFPSEEYPVLTFGFFGMNIVTNEQGDLTPEIEKFYHQNEAYDTKGWFSILEDLTDHLATLANHNIRVAAKGLLIYNKGRIIVKVYEIGVYIKDSFNFNDSRFLPSQPLGYFNFTNNSVSKTPGSGFYYFDNDSYKRYRVDHKKGGDFELYSEVIKVTVLDLNADISLEEKDPDVIRNQFNVKPSSNPPKSFYDEIDGNNRYYTDSKNQRWKLEEDANSVLHQPKDLLSIWEQAEIKLSDEITYDLPNKKYTLLHEDGSSSEAIWDSKKNRWLEDWEVGGPTFNYVDNSISSWGHFLDDMLPFWKYQRYGRGIKVDERLDRNSFFLDGHDYPEIAPSI